MSKFISSVIKNWTRHIQAVAFSINTKVYSSDGDSHREKKPKIPAI